MKTVSYRGAAKSKAVRKRALAASTRPRGQYPIRRRGLVAAGWADSKMNVAREQATVERETARMRARIAVGSSRDR